MEPGQPEASLGQADAVIPNPVAGQSPVSCMPGHASAVYASLIVCHPAGPVSGCDVSVGSFPRPRCPLKMGARFKSRGFGSKKTGDLCSRRRIPTAPGLGTDVPSAVGFSTRSRPESGRFRPGRPKRRVSEALLGVPRNGCRIPKQGGLRRHPWQDRIPLRSVSRGVDIWDTRSGYSSARATLRPPCRQPPPNGRSC